MISSYPFSITDIYQTIRNLNNPKTVKACFGVHIRKWLSFLPSAIDGRVLTPMSNTYIMKILSSFCDTVTIVDTSYTYELIPSQLSTNRFVSPGASECAIDDTHWVRNGAMIAVNDRILNLTTLFWSQLYSILQLSCSCHILNREYSAPLRTHESQVPYDQTKNVWSHWTLIGITPFSRLDSNISIIGYRLLV